MVSQSKRMRALLMYSWRHPMAMSWRIWAHGHFDGVFHNAGIECHCPQSLVYRH
jgi:hypothetical protein